MTFEQSIKICLGKKYLFRFSGRASRSEFWWFMLFIILVNLATAFLAGVLPPAVGASLSFAISLLLFPANLGVTVRRLHDRGLHGWWLLLPVIALFFWILSGAPQTANPLGNVLCLGMCLVYLVILCMPGQEKGNRFGPPPAADV